MHRHARPGRPARRAWRCSICSGDRDAFQLVSDAGHRALPEAGRLRPGPDDPGRGRSSATASAPSTTAAIAAHGRRDQRQPARRARRRREDRRQVDQPVRRLRRRGRARRPDQGQGRRQPARAPRPTCCATTSSTGWSTTSSCRCTRATPRWRGWDREQVHQVFDTLQFRVLRDRLYEYLEAVEPEAESGFDLAGAILGTGDGAGLARPARAGRGAGRRGRRRPVRPGHRRADRARGRHRRRPGRLVRPDRARRRRRDRGRRLARRSDPAEGDPRRQAGHARLRRARLDAARASTPTPRSRPTWPGRTSAPTT